MSQRQIAAPRGGSDHRQRLVEGFPHACGKSPPRGAAGAGRSSTPSPPIKQSKRRRARSPPAGVPTLDVWNRQGSTARAGIATGARSPAPSAEHVTDDLASRHEVARRPLIRHGRSSAFCLQLRGSGAPVGAIGSPSSRIVLAPPWDQHRLGKRRELRAWPCARLPLLLLLHHPGPIRG